MEQCSQWCAAFQSTFVCRIGSSGWSRCRFMTWWIYRRSAGPNWHSISSSWMTLSFTECLMSFITLKDWLCMRHCFSMICPISLMPDWSTRPTGSRMIPGISVVAILGSSSFQPCFTSCWSILITVCSQSSVLVLLWLLHSSLPSRSVSQSSSEMGCKAYEMPLVSHSETLGHSGWSLTSRYKIEGARNSEP